MNHVMYPLIGKKIPKCGMYFMKCIFFINNCVKYEFLNSFYVGNENCRWKYDIYYVNGKEK